MYDRIADPAELINVIDRHPDVAARLERELADLLAAMPKRDAVTASLDDKTIRALESLGYVGVGASTVDAGTNQLRRDPKDMLPVFRDMCKATSLLQQHRFAEVVQLLEPLAAESPESDELHGLLGEAYVNLGMFKEAERACRASLRTITTNPRKWCRLGDALLGQSKTDEAVRCYQQALVADAEYGTAHNRLGAIYLQKKQIAKAHEHFRRHLELKPNSPNALTNLANVLPQLGRHGEAVRLVRRALEIDPNHAAGHRFLWQVLLTTGQRVEAISALRAARKALPDDRELKRHLVGLLALAPEAGADAKREAIRLAKECCEANAANPENFGVLGVAYAATGDFPNAIEATRRAGSLADAQGKAALANIFAVQLQAYEQGRTR
jgi:tetratricopeptide (TPR) repeat protein